MRQPMIAVKDAVDAAFYDLFATAKLLFCRGHFLTGRYQTKFSLSDAHIPGSDLTGKSDASELPLSCVKQQAEDPKGVNHR